MTGAGYADFISSRIRVVARHANTLGSEFLSKVIRITGGTFRRNSSGAGEAGEETGFTGLFEGISIHVRGASVFTKFKCHVEEWKVDWAKPGHSVEEGDAESSQYTSDRRCGIVFRLNDDLMVVPVVRCIIIPCEFKPTLLRICRKSSPANQRGIKKLSSKSLGLTRRQYGVVTLEGFH